MYSINNDIITISRGDSFTFETLINLGNPIYPDYYTLQEGDIVYFGIMEPNQPFEWAIVRKTFTSEDQEGSVLICSFNPEDSEFLLPGRYYYSLKLYKASDESVTTFIPNKKFIIMD